MNVTPINRIVQGMLEWQRKEQAMADLFSPATLQTRYFQQLKLHYFRELRRSVGRSANPEERMTAKILKGELQQLERKLYPRLMSRLIARLVQTMRRKQRQEPAAPGQRTDWLLKIDAGLHRANGKDQARKVDHRRAIEPILKKRQQEQTTKLKR